MTMPHGKSSVRVTFPITNSDVDKLELEVDLRNRV